jgi:hypothetical protein
MCMDKYNLHTLPTDGGTELKGSPGNSLVKGDIPLSAFLKAGTLLSFVSSSREHSDISCPRNANCTLKARLGKIYTIDLEHEGRSYTISFVEALVKKGMKSGDMLRWDYDWGSFCGGRIPDRVSDVNKRYYGVDISEMKFLKEMNERIRNFLFSQGYTDSD